MAGELFAHVGHEFRLFHGLGADNHVLNPGLQIGLNRLSIANTATDLNRQIRVGFGNGGDDFAVDRLAGKRAIQIHQMQTPGTGIHPSGCGFQRAAGKYRGVLHTTLAQSHTFTVF